MIQLHWLMLFAAAFVLAQPLCGADVHFKKTGQGIEVVVGGLPFTTYVLDEGVAKPYLMPLRTASGIQITRSFPVANKVTADDQKTRSFEPHQRPLYFGHGNINGLNFWAEKAFSGYYNSHVQQRYGSMSLIQVEQMTAGASKGTLLARFNLLDAAGQPIAEETQSFTFVGDERTRIIDCQFIVNANHGPVTFGDTKEGTFALRLGAELSAPHDHMVNSAGAEGERAIWGKPADWVEYSGIVSGKPVSVAVFESPKSFRHPTTWHARAYGLLAANPFGLREFTSNDASDGSWTVPEGKSVIFRYRVSIYDGKRTISELADLYRLYAGN